MSDRAMMTDHQTLSELEILPSGPDAVGFLQLMKPARTRGGRETLRARFSAPFSTPGAILAAQDVLRFLLPRLRPSTRLIDAQAVVAVEHYLDSRYAVGSFGQGVGAEFAARWTAFRYRDLVSEAAIGITSVKALAEISLQLCAELTRADTPADLAMIVTGLAASAGAVRDTFGRVRAPRSAAGVLRLDSLFRGEFRPRVQACLEWIHVLDALLAMAETTRDRDWVFPAIASDPEPATLVLGGLRHPLLDRPVANDVRLDANVPLMFLTGPNMAGKTTLMKAVGIAVYLAQLGMGVPAASMRFTPFAGILSGIGAADTVRLGYSFFLSEVRRLRQAAEHLATGRRWLLLFDEVLRGTHAGDALDAAFAVVASFAQCRTSATIISSHAFELVPRIERLPGVALRHFEVSLEGSRPSYPYRLEDGAFSGRPAAAVLAQERLLEALGALPPG